MLRYSSIDMLFGLFFFLSARIIGILDDSTQIFTAHFSDWFQDS